MQIEERTLTLNNNTAVTIKSASERDAVSICQHRYITSQETYFLARYPEECCFPIEMTQQRLREMAESSCDFTVTAFINGKVIGDLAVNQVRNHLKFQHRAHMGISIQKQFWGMGIGNIMVAYAVEQAARNGFEQLELGVFEDNIPAIRLYEKFGFQKYGTHPRAFKLKDGTYRDEIMMVKML